MKALNLSSQQKKPLNKTAKALVILLLSASLLEADWPRFHGPTGDGHLPSSARALTQLPSEVPLVWRKTIGNTVGSPVIAENRVFYLDNQQEKETVHCLELTTGKEIWSKPLDAVFKDSQTPPGARSTPLVHEGKVYVQSCRGELQCLKTSDGSLIWQKSFAKDFGAEFIGEKGQAMGASRHGFNGSPWIEGKMLIVAAGGTNGSSLVALDKDSGKVIWQNGSQTAGYTGPAVGTIRGKKQIAYFTATSVLGADLATGKTLWEVPIKTAFGRHVTVPLFHKDHVIVSSHQAGLMAIKVTEIGAEPAWVSKDHAINFASPVLVNGFLYGVGPSKNLICLEPLTGKLSWSQENFFTTAAGKNYAGMIVMNDNILVLNDSGQLSLIAANPKEFQNKGTAQVCGQNWCNPAFSNGLLVVIDQKEIRCLKLL